MTAFYNENDPFAAQWLRNLIAAGRVGKLRAYGNAIVAPVAEEFIRAYMDTAQGC